MKAAEMPAPRGNRNAMRHGTYGYLAIGSLPKGASYIRRLAGEMERGLQTAVAAKHGEISLYHAAVCQTAVRHETRAQLLTRWLRHVDGADGKVNLMDRVTIMREIGAASDARDRCLRALGLDRESTASVIDALYAPKPEGSAANAPVPPPHAADVAACGNGAGNGSPWPGEATAGGTCGSEPETEL